MLLVNILLACTLFLSLVLALAVLISNPKKSVNRSMAALIAGAASWVLANFLTNLSADPSKAMFFAKATLIGPIMFGYTFVVFTKIYSRTRQFTLAKMILYALPAFVCIALSPTRYNVESISAYGNNMVPGVMYIPVSLLVFTYLAIGFRSLSRLFKQTKDQVIKAQIRYMFIAFGVILIPAFITNALLPLLGYDAPAQYGPIAASGFVAITAIAIIRHRLLDIRLIVARTLTYTLSLVSAAMAFSVLVMIGSSYAVGLGSLSMSQQAYYTFAAIMLAFLFQPLKKFFDKHTSRLFYQDAYDPQRFIAQLNKAIVSTIKLKKLLDRVSEVVGVNFKSEFAYTSLHSNLFRGERFFGSPPAGQDKRPIERLYGLLSGVNTKIIITDDLSDDFSDLRRLLNSQNIAVAARLMSNVKDSSTEMGMLILGSKRSGNLYNDQDRRMLEIVSNELLIAIQNSLGYEEIQQFNQTLQESIDKATRELRRSNEKLKILDETKDEFISMASHQLRTPLTSVKGYLSMVLEGDAGKLTSQQERLLKQAFFSSQRMVYLISDLLNVSRLRTGKFVIEPTPTALPDIIKGEINQLIETAEARGLKIKFTPPKDFPLLMLDETKIRQVIMNFLDNAIYYSPGGGKVIVELEERPKAVELRISDGGIGVPKDQQHQLFEKFYRADNAKRARPDGTGIGLFMAQKVVIAQGGAIIFKSVEGKGSTFGFTFPKSKLKAK